MDRLAELNPAQRAAVETLSGPLLVLAGAGTGKTRVITHRMVALIESGIPPERILCVTFTNKAALEMKQRAAALLRRRTRRLPLVCTFHALCARILREEIAVLGYPNNFAIYDRADQETVAREALREIRVTDKALRPRDLLAIISRWKTAGVLPPAALENASNDQEVLAAAAYRRYQQRLQANGAVDFDDLLLLTARLFETHAPVLRRHQQRFDHVQIDEYQDTNALQFVVVEALVRPHHNLCVVGDDDQSIYGWRGAEITHILEFQRHFPGAKVVRLEENYRCSARIVELANRLVRGNRRRHPKQLRSTRPACSEVRFLEFPDEAEEAKGVVTEIATLIRRHGVPPGDFAILVRTNEQPRPFETALRRERLPYVLLGGSSFFDRKEVRDLLAYLRTIAHPTDEVALRRIINTPPRGLGATTIGRLVEQSVREQRSVWETICDPAVQQKLSTTARSSLHGFCRLVERYRTRFESEPRRMPEIVEALIREIDYDAEIERQTDDPQAQTVRRAVVASVVDAVAEYVQQAESPSLAGFLEESTLAGREEEPDRDEPEREGIRLMTLHAAKGLEFPRVYLVGLEEGLLPHRRAVETGSMEAIEEERRLAYVGITRAQDHLTLTRALQRRKWGRLRPTLPSRFLHELRNDTNQ